MKSLINLILLTCLVSLTCFTVLRTQAESIKNNSPIIHQNKRFVLIFAFPQHTSGGGKETYTTSLITPLVNNSHAVTHTENNEKAQMCPSKKGNEVYELTALFNDKLQVLLSFFAPQKHHENLQEVIKDKESIQVVVKNNR